MSRATAALWATMNRPAGRIAEGRAVAEDILKANPGFCVKKVNVPFKYKVDREAVLEAVRKVDIPDKPPLPLPDKPSIAVLPFTNMSGDPKHLYHAGPP